MSLKNTVICLINRATGNLEPRAQNVLNDCVPAPTGSRGLTICQATSCVAPVLRTEHSVRRLLGV